MKDLRHHVFMCKTKEGLLSSESDDDSLNVPAFTSGRISESSTTVKDGQPAENVNDGESLSVPTFSPGRNLESTTSLQDGQAENPPRNSFALESTISSSNAIAAVPVVDNLYVDEIVGKVVVYCSAENISNPVEILRCLQKDVVTGQPVEVTDVTDCSREQTNFILVDRNNLLSAAFDELRSFEDYCVTLEVQFYDEVRPNLSLNKVYPLFVLLVHR